MTVNHGKKAEMTVNQDKRVWITIDTEMDADAHWKKSWPPDYTSLFV